MRGLDVLGIASRYWDMKSTLKAWQQGVALGLFADDTFGINALPNTIKLLETGKVPAVRAHLNWDYKHQLPPIDKIKKLAPKWEALAKKYPAVRFYISPSCEINTTDKAGTIKRLNITRDLCPSCTVVYSPMRNPLTSGYMLEKHGKTTVGAGQIISYDGGKSGEGLYDIDAARWVKDNSNAEVAFSWSPLLNMAEAHNSLPPNQRKSSPSAAYLTGHIRLFDPPGSPPTPSFGVVQLKKPELYKSFAENSQGVDPRNSRPLFIGKDKAESIELVTFTGKSVGKFIYYGGFPPNLSRYYSGYKNGLGLYGWQISDKAQQISGSPWVWIKSKGKFIGPIHPTFRTPFYQA